MKTTRIEKGEAIRSCLYALQNGGERRFVRSLAFPTTALSNLSSDSVAGAARPAENIGPRTLLHL